MWSSVLSLPRGPDRRLNHDIIYSNLWDFGRILAISGLLGDFLMIKCVVIMFIKRFRYSYMRLFIL